MRYARREDGIAMIAGLVVLVIIGILGGSAVYFTSTNEKTAERSASTSVTRSLAESGIAEALAVIAKPTNDRTNPGLVPAATTNHTEGDVTWSGVYDAGTATWTLTAEGVVANPAAEDALRHTVSARVWVADITYASAVNLGDGTTDYEIFAMNSDGTGAQPLTNNNVAERYPHWSPDGQTLVFTSELASDALPGADSGSSGAAPNANRDVYTMKPDGSDLTRLTTNAGTVGYYMSSKEEDPTWGPSGKIFYASSINGHQGGGPSSTLYNSDLYAMDTDGANKVNLTPCQLTPANYWTYSGTTCSNDQEPSWSGDGLLCVESSAGTGTDSIHAIPVTVQPNGSIVTGTPYDMIGVPGSTHLNCSFSTDGSKMVYTSDQDGDFEIFVLDIGSGTHTQLTNNTAADRQPGFTIDGRIVFGSDMTSGAGNSNNADGNKELFIMNADGSGIWQLTATTGTAVNNWPDVRHEFRPFEYSG